MARNEEKAQGLMNRWTQMKIDMAAPLRGKRPHLATLCENLSDCEFWRRQIIKEIQKLVGDIQNAGLGEHALRDMNDDINKKIREKRHWERQIKKLGGPNYMNSRIGFDEQGQAIKGGGGYLYFGATKDLPGVRELFHQEAPKKKRRTRHEIVKNITSDYYGYRDEDDGLLLAAEEAAEAAMRLKLAEEKQAVKQRSTEANGNNSKAIEVEESSDDEEDNEPAADKKNEVDDATTNANVRALVPVPDQAAIEQLIMARRRMELMSKYASADLRKEETSAKTLLNVKR